MSPDPVDRTVAHPTGLVNDGSAAVVKYLTGYVVELSLSVDNMFVIAMLFRFFAVPAPISIAFSSGAFSVRSRCEA